MASDERGIVADDDVSAMVHRDESSVLVTKTPLTLLWPKFTFPHRSTLFL